MSTTPKTDELDEVSCCMSDEETVRAYKKLARLVEEENAALRAEVERLREELKAARTSFDEAMDRVHGQLRETEQRAEAA